MVSKLGRISGPEQENLNAVGSLSLIKHGYLMMHINFYLKIFNSF